MNSRKMIPADVPYIMDSSLKTLRVFYQQLPGEMFYPLYRGIMASIIRDGRTKITIVTDGTIGVGPDKKDRILAYSMVAEGNSMFSHGTPGVEADEKVMMAMGIAPGMGYTFNGDILARCGGNRLPGRHLAQFLESGGHV